MAAHIWPDDEFPVALDGVMVVSAAVIELNLLYRRSGARRLFQGRRVDRNGTGALELTTEMALARVKALNAIRMGSSLMLLGASASMILWLASGRVCLGFSMRDT